KRGLKRFTFLVWGGAISAACVSGSQRFTRLRGWSDDVVLRYQWRAGGFGPQEHEPVSDFVVAVMEHGVRGFIGYEVELEFRVVQAACASTTGFEAGIEQGDQVGRGCTLDDDGEDPLHRQCAFDASGRFDRCLVRRG